MKKFLFFAALCCLLAFANPVNAQLVIRNSGHAELGTKPSGTDTDTVTMLKIFGEDTAIAPGARITFGDLAPAGTNVAVGEYGTGNTDQLWLHGRLGTYFTKGSGTAVGDTIAFFDPNLSTMFTFNGDVMAHGLIVQSDERLKEDIEPIEDVLSSLKVLEPVTYRLKSHRVGKPAMMNDSKEAEIMNRYYRDLEQGSERYGFLAQNVKEVFPELVHTDNNGYMSVDYIGLIPILVQSINELRAELAEVKGELKQEDSTMMQSPQQAGQNEIEASRTSAMLYQNAPNPWNSETVIRYRLPQSVSKADIYIYDLQGIQLKSIPANGRGESQVTLTASDLKAGMYQYALVADGKLIDSKKMILTK